MCWFFFGGGVIIQNIFLGREDSFILNCTLVYQQQPSLLERTKTLTVLGQKVNSIFEFLRQ